MTEYEHKSYGIGGALLEEGFYTKGELLKVIEYIDSMTKLNRSQFNIPKKGKDDESIN